MSKILKFGIIVLLFFTSANIFAQETHGLPTDELTGKIYYKKVVDVSGTKDELYHRGQKWLHTFFRNASSAIRLLDQEAGVIEGRRVFKAQILDKKGRPSSEISIKYTFRIEMKDGKYRVLLYDFKQGGSNGKEVEAWFDDKDPKAQAIHEQVYKQINEDANKLIASLQKGMRPKEIKHEEW